MAAHNSVGALAANNTGPISPAIPDTTAGLFALLVVSMRANTTFTVNSADGSWTLLHETAQSFNSFAVYYRRLTGGDTDPSVDDVAGSGNGIFGYVICAEDIVGSGSPLDVAEVTNSGSGTTGTASGVTTATDGALLYSLFFARDDTGGTGGWSNPLRSGGSPAAVASGNAYESTVGSDSALGSCAEVIATAGATGDTTMDVATTQNWESLTIALTPAATAITGSGAPAAQAAATAGTSERELTGSGTPASQVSTLSGAAERVLTCSGSLLSAASSASGTATLQLKLLLTAAAGRELRDEAGAVVANLASIAFEWYDKDTDTSGAPDVTGTFSTNATGEATVQLPGSGLTSGQFGLLVLKHPTDTAIWGIYRIPVT